MNSKMCPDTAFRNHSKEDYFAYRLIMLWLCVLNTIWHAVAEPQSPPPPKANSTESIKNEASLPPSLIPQAKNTQGDPLQKVLSSPFEGKIAYAFTPRNSAPSFPSYLFIKYINKLASQINDTKSLLSQQVYTLDGRTTHSVVFSPQFSPNGRYVLFKVGNASNTTGSYYLFILDTETNQLKQVSARKLRYRIVLWSPDSNHLAYIAGGDYEGNVGHLFGEPLRLFVCNWRNGKETLIVKNDSVRGSFTWANSNTLLYGVLPNVDHKVNSKKATSILRPNIYEHSLTDGKSRLLIEDGYRPNVSPDGKWIAFFGSENPDKPLPLGRNWMVDPNYSALTVTAYDKVKRIALTREKGSYPAISWRRGVDGEQRVITLNQIQPSPKAKAEIRDWDIATKKFRRVAELAATDSITLQRSVVHPQFDYVEKTPNGKYIFVNVSEIGTDNQKAGGYAAYTTLSAIDISDGTIVQILRGRPVVDWHFISSNGPDTVKP